VLSSLDHDDAIHWCISRLTAALYLFGNSFRFYRIIFSTDLLYVFIVSSVFLIIPWQAFQLCRNVWQSRDFFCYHTVGVESREVSTFPISFRVLRIVTCEHIGSRMTLIADDHTLMYSTPFPPLSWSSLSSSSGDWKISSILESSEAWRTSGR